ncbi:hypothetical protein ACFWXH_30250 [Mesorhizobium sp. NPDC059054]|uniref:hypothetical protein n=1 Tax=unclassified Mesorhizobium TaxID=325217 RepID=UPI0006C75840|nr:hypothetical protein [Mesorhizobium sp. 1M-11]
MVLFWFDQQERLKTAKGKELLSSDRRGEIAPTNVAAAPKPVEGKIAVRIGSDGRPVVVIKDGPAS